jgi:hypothetical protein
MALPSWQKNENYTQTRKKTKSQKDYSEFGCEIEK